MTDVAPETIFHCSEAVVVRPQRQEFLFYNSRSDELHLIPPAGRAVFMLCDGRRTVDDIVREVASGSGMPVDRVRSSVAAFLGRLEARGLVERSDV